MIYYDRIDVLTKLMLIKQAREKIVCHYWYFVNYSFKCQPNVCNRCHVY